MRRRFLGAAVAVGLIILAWVLVSVWPERTPDYFPMKPGSRWNYAVTTVAVAPGRTDTLGTGTMTLEALGPERLVVGVEAMGFAFSGDLPVGMPRDRKYFRKTKDHLLFYMAEFDADPDTVLVLPLRPQMVWSVHGDIPARVVGRQGVEVPAGRFRDCWLVQFSLDGDETWRLWFAGNTGVVKMAMSEENLLGTRFLTLIELKSASVK